MNEKPVSRGVILQGFGILPIDKGDSKGESCQKADTEKYRIIERVGEKVANNTDPKPGDVEPIEVVAGGFFDLWFFK